MTGQPDSGRNGGRRRFTGWHMLFILIAFFGVIFIVNLVMARFAISTFSGTVVDNSYVASQNFNRWLEEGRAQQQLGWSVAVDQDSERHLILRTQEQDAPLSGLTVAVIASHPFGHSDAQRLEFVPLDEGAYRSLQSLPEGRWKLQIELRRGEDVARFLDEVTL